MYVFGLIFYVYLDGSMGNVFQESWECSLLEIFRNIVFIERTKLILRFLSVNNQNIDF